MGKIYEALEKAESRKQRVENEPVSLSSLEFEFNNDLVVLGKPRSAIVEQFRFLRTKVTKPLIGSPSKTILITSSMQGEGKTFVACNLAVTIAQGLDEHVLLVDADLRSPRVHKVFGLESNNKGLTEHLMHDIPLQNLLYKTNIEKLTILAAGVAENPAEILTSRKMKTFIEEVRDRYPDRYIIFDSPPLELAPESIALSNEVDGVLLILQRGRTPREMVKKTLQKLNRDKFLGIVFNGYSELSKRYGKSKALRDNYNYGYGYGYGYSKASKKNS